MIELDDGVELAAAPPAPDAGGRGRRRPRRRRGDRGRQAARPGRPPGRRHARRHARQRAAGPLPRAGRRWATPGGPASSTGSTRARAACSWWPARRRPTRRSSPSWRPARSSGATWRWCGAHPASAGRPRRRPDRAVAARPAADGRRRPTGARPGTRYEVRATFDDPAADGAARLPARDRAHPPDPRAPRRHRAPRGRRRHATAGPARRWTCRGRSCTPTASASTTPRPASA